MCPLFSSLRPRSGAAPDAAAAAARKASVEKFGGVILLDLERDLEGDLDRDLDCDLDGDLGDGDLDLGLFLTGGESDLLDLWYGNGDEEVLVGVLDRDLDLERLLLLYLLRRGGDFLGGDLDGDFDLDFDLEDDLDLDLDLLMSFLLLAFCFALKNSYSPSFSHPSLSRGLSWNGGL